MPMNESHLILSRWFIFLMIREMMLMIKKRVVQQTEFYLKMRRDGQYYWTWQAKLHRYLHNHKHINIGSSHTIILWRTQTP